MEDDALKNAEDNAAQNNDRDDFLSGSANRAITSAASRDAKGRAAVSGLKLAGKAKKLAPLLIVVVVVIALWGVASFIGQFLFPFGFKSRMTEDWNSTNASSAARTDAMMEEQMTCEEDPEFSDTVYSDIGFSESQKKSFESAGLGYKQDGCTTILTFTDSDGTEKYVTSNGSLSQYMNGGEAVADGGDVVSDSGAEIVSEDEAKSQILDNMQIAAEPSQVMSLSEAMNNTTFKNAYITATKWWRGDTSGWFTEMTETVMERLGISRNNYNGFEVTGDEKTDREAFLELAKSKVSASEGSDIGDKSLMERVKEVAEESKVNAPDCGTSSAFNDVEGVISADQTARQVSAGSLWLEAIDKTMAGEGSSAPLSVANNIVVSSGGANSQGVTQLFGNGVVEQTNELVQKVSAQAHGNEVNSSSGLDTNTYRECMYVGNTNRYDNAGAITKIGSVFKRVGSWISEAASGISNVITSILDDFLGGKGDSAVAESSLSTTVAKYEEMKNQSYFNGNDTSLIGEALVSASERIFNEKAKSAGQVIGDESALLASYRANQEILAEEAEHDRATKSPLDITSKNTFLGSIAYSLIPFATSQESISLTSTAQNLGSLISNSVSSLLPTSQAISEAQVVRGDCVLSNNIGAVSNEHCNNYYNSDLELSKTSATKILNQVARLRYDTGGYEIRKQYKNASGIYVDLGKDDPNYGEGPLNTNENNKCVSEYNTYGEPVAWRYSRYTNFEYEGYQSGWHNRTSSGTVGIEDAKNDVDPEQCVLDVKVSDDKQPVINMNGALGVFILMSGQRSSEWGSADDSNLKILLKSDFTKGRLHPCTVDSDECESDYYVDLGWSTKSKDFDLNSFFTDAQTRFEAITAKSPVMSRLIGGSAFLDFNNNLGNLKELGGIDSDERFKDPTRENDYFWNEMKYYQAYTELQEWMESAGLISTSTATVAVNRYYEENPLDNSYAGVIARYSGMSKDRVVAVLDLMEYVAFLDGYNPVGLYPTPVSEPEEIHYDNSEVVARAETVLQSISVVYADLRGRTEIA